MAIVPNFHARRAACASIRRIKSAGNSIPTRRTTSRSLVSRTVLEGTVCVLRPAITSIVQIPIAICTNHAHQTPDRAENLRFCTNTAAKNPAMRIICTKTAAKAARSSSKVFGAAPPRHVRLKGNASDPSKSSMKHIFPSVEPSRAIRSKGAMFIWAEFNVCLTRQVRQLTDNPTRKLIAADDVSAAQIHRSPQMVSKSQSALKWGVRNNNTPIKRVLH